MDGWFSLRAVGEADLGKMLVGVWRAREWRRVDCTSRGVPLAWISNIFPWSRGDISYSVARGDPAHATIVVYCVVGDMLLLQRDSNLEWYQTNQKRKSIGLLLGTTGLLIRRRSVSRTITTLSSAKDLAWPRGDVRRKTLVGWHS